MKKLLLTILLLLNLIQLPVALALPVYSGDLLARITLDPALKPTNSPGVIFGDAQLQQVGEQNAFGTYLLQVLAGALISIAAPVAIVIIAVGGLMLVTANGAAAGMDKAKKTIKWAIIGLIVIIFSWVITRGVIDVLVSTNQNPTQTNSTSATNPVSGTKGGSTDVVPATTTPAG